MKKGDLYLFQIAKIFSSFSPDKNVASRLDGDEFILFLHHYQDKKK